MKEKWIFLLTLSVIIIVTSAYFFLWTEGLGREFNLTLKNPNPKRASSMPTICRV